MARQYIERRYSLEEYLDLEEKSCEKHEFYRGRVYQMAGGSAEHAIITNNTSTALTNSLREKPCIVYSNDMLIKVETKSHYTYADASVVCGKPEYEQIKKRQVLTNPALLVEVLSPSTRDYDRGTKFQRYKALASFQDYLLVDSRQRYVQHFRKLDENTWQEKTYTQPEQTIIIENLGINLTLAELYRNVEFKARPKLLLGNSEEDEAE